MNHADVAVRRDDAIESVARKADEIDAQWTERAYATLFLYCMHHKTPFIIEQAREWGEGLGLIIPPHDSRAWGAVVRRAAKGGLIVKCGFAAAKSSNLSPKVQWVAV